MKVKPNTIHHGDFLEVMKGIADNSIDCILIDPPYVGMINQTWDRLSESEALIFFNGLILESQRVLRFGGRFISFCSNDTLQYLYSELKHRELLIIDKGMKNVSAGRNTKRYKQHINHCEYVYVSTKYAREYTRSLLLEQAKKFNISAKEINKLIGVSKNGGGMWSIYTGENICNQVPTKERWNQFRIIFPNLPLYETFEEVFNNDLGKGNILPIFNFRMKCRLHPTQKPVALMEYLIKTYSNEGETILDFTMGSGTTGVACQNLNRNFIGIEKDPTYFEVAQKRLGIKKTSELKKKFIVKRIKRKVRSHK